MPELAEALKQDHDLTATPAMLWRHLIYRLKQKTLNLTQNSLPLDAEESDVETQILMRHVSG